MARATLTIRGGKIYATGPRRLDTRPPDVQARESRERLDKLIEELRAMGKTEHPPVQLKLIKREE